MSDFLTTPPQSDPGMILNLRDRQYAAELIATALLHFDLFSWLDRNPGVAPERIAAELRMVARPLDVLLTLCRAYGFAATTGAGGVELTTNGREFLVSGSAWFLGAYYAPIRDTPIVRAFVEVLRSGAPGSWQAKSDASDWHKSMLDPEFARGFTELMNCRGLVFGQALAVAIGPHLGGRRHLLDVGGGSGIYASTMVAAHPQLCATVLEQAPVDAIVRAEIDRHGLADRVAVLTADMFAAAWPETDILLFSNVLHDWDVPEVRGLLERAAKALVPGGLLIIHDAFINDAKSGPIEAAEYSALLMNITQGKCYSPVEHGALLSELGFEVGSYQDTVASRGFMTAIRQG
jgi:hypothetical protein